MSCPEEKLLCVTSLGNIAPLWTCVWPVSCPVRKVNISKVILKLLGLLVYFRCFDTNIKHYISVAV